MESSVTHSRGSCPNICSQGWVVWRHQVIHWWVRDLTVFLNPTILKRRERINESRVGTACSRRMCSKQTMNLVIGCLLWSMMGCILECDNVEWASHPLTRMMPSESRKWWKERRQLLLGRKPLDWRETTSCEKAHLWENLIHSKLQQTKSRTVRECACAYISSSVAFFLRISSFGQNAESMLWQARNEQRLSID